jgi:two-component system, chemotaxis family, chemotaxis protein CheY
MVLRSELEHFSSRAGNGAKRALKTVMRILVVDDSAGARAYVRGALETSPRLPNLCLVEAAGGFDALRLLPRGPYDLVITDINMGDINGLELVSFIRSQEQYASTSILLISTQASILDQQRGLALGAAAFLAKPFTPQVLLHEVLRLTSRVNSHG